MIQRLPLLTAILGLALTAWVVAVQQMRGMDAGPGTDLGALGWFLGVWVTMMVAMMLPAAAPAVVMFASLRRSLHTALFVSGYLAAWTIYGLGAYVAYRGLRYSAPSFLAWDDGGPLVAGAALVAAGLYQLAPLKTACLRHCRSPLHFLLRSRPGALGSARTGLAHGAYCVGCCTGLMLALFALGVMSLVWMAAVAVAILVEKAAPRGAAFARLFAVALVALGFWVATSPGSVPALVQPAGTTGMEMQP